MTKRRILDILLGLIFLSLTGLYFYNHFFVSNKMRHAAHLKLIKANDILKRKTVIPESILNTTATSSACTLFLRNSAELPMNEYANEFLDHQNDGIVKTCAGALPTQLQHQIDKTILECKKSSRNNILKICYNYLIDAKTASVAAIIKNDINPVELDSALLLQLISAKYNSGELLEFPEKGLALIDALIEKEPNYPGSYKVKALLIASSLLGKEENYQNMIHDSLSEAKKLNPKDPEIREIEITLKGDLFKKISDEGPEDQKRKSAFVEYLNEESLKYPKEWIFDYYKAYVLYDGNKENHEQTIVLIENALNKAPQENRLKQTLENLKSDDARKKLQPFIIGMDCAFNLNDL